VKEFGFLFVTQNLDFRTDMKNTLHILRLIVHLAVDLRIS